MSPRRPLVPPAEPPRRYGTRPLPSYRHQPGLTPHPINHPEGHSHGRREGAADPRWRRLPTGWQHCEPYLHGVDLFNRAFLWEAHEEWEALWHAVGTGSVPGRFLQAAIQIAAALLKHHLGHPRGVAFLLARSQRHLETAGLLPATGPYMGVDLDRWRRAVERYLDRPAGSAASPFPFIRLVSS